MYTERICQSCSMPLSDNKMLGTEKDGSKNKEYCIYCYKDGYFVNPSVTLEQMKGFIKWKMNEMKIDSAITDKALSVLPFLKRWNRSEEVFQKV